MKKLGKCKKYITGVKELRKVMVSRLRSRETEIKITKEENKLIERNRELLHGKNIIAIDIKKIRLNVKPTTTPDAAVWVAIIDLNEDILLNNTIRYPVSCIADTCTEFHGIDINMICGG